MDKLTGAIPVVISTKSSSHGVVDSIQCILGIICSFPVDIGGNCIRLNLIENIIRASICKDNNNQQYKNNLQPFSKIERSEEHTSELQSRGQLVCRHLL